MPPPVALKLMVPFSHTGVLLPMVITGAGVMSTVVVLVAEHPDAVTVTVYVPPAAVIAANEGFCEVLANEFGPAQE